MAIVQLRSQTPGGPGGADIEIFTGTTTFAIMKSIRLDREPQRRFIPDSNA